VTWDGTGYGPDGTVWGGEFLLGDATGYQRVAHLRPFRLPGGDAAVHEPRRVALALLWEMYGEDALAMDDLAAVAAFSPSERRLLGAALSRGINAPVTTSAGRLFDAIAALAGLQQQVTFEGQAAMSLEFAAGSDEGGMYPFPCVDGVLDWQPLVDALLSDLRRGTETATIAARFHNSLTRAIVEVARRVGERRVALTGGCFQNRLLVERTADALETAGFEVLLHSQVPPNDGGISLGQLAVAAARLKTG
jgi:hydrogenase maturation protein HypF